MDKKRENEEQFYYPLPTLLFLLYATGGILYTLACTGVFTALTAMRSFIPAAGKLATPVFLSLMAFGCFFALIMTLSILFRREIIPFIPTRKIWMAYLVKLSQSIAKRTFLDPDKAVRSFINLSNDFVINELKKSKDISRVLFLLPHCIQLNSCAFKITSDVYNCRKCGKCAVSTFIDLAERFHFGIYVSTGGTAARNVIVERRPNLILAVACERDLLSGIKDTLKLPVVGILNERPNGPCYNTTVDPESVESMLTRIFT